MSPIGVKTASPLDQLTLDRFGGHILMTETFYTVQVGFSQILPNNPNRVQWLMQNSDINDVRIASVPSFSPTTGWLLAAAGGLVSMSWFEDGDAVGYAVYAYGITAPTAITIREFVRL